MFVGGCRRAPIRATAWSWEGCDPAGTHCYPVPGHTDSPFWNLNPIWEAEDYPTEACELDPVTKAEAYRLLTADINGDGKLEILTGNLGAADILSRDGVALRIPSAGQTIRSVADFDRLPAVVGCSARTVHIMSGPHVQRIDIGHNAISALVANLRPRALTSSPFLVTVEQLERLDGHDGVQVPLNAICGYELPSGRQRWCYKLGASVCHLWAVADVNGDSTPEFIFGTYGYEHGISFNGIADSLETWVICLDTAGREVWKTSHTGHPHLYAKTLVTDADGDGRPEVVAVFGSWDRQSGALEVLDGRTGQIKAQYPPDASVPIAFNGLGAADVDHDGRMEIAATSTGKPARVWLFRLGSSDGRPVLESLASRDIAAGISESFVNADIAALCDFDGDDSLEIVVTTSHETQIDDDPYYYPSKITQSRLLVLDAKLAVVAEVALSSGVKRVAVSDLNGQGKNGILVMTDRLGYYEPR